MKFSLEIETDSAAFEGDAFDPEIARILRRVADNIEAGEGPEDGQILTLRDINGNKVGETWLIED